MAITRVNKGDRVTLIPAFKRPDKGTVQATTGTEYARVRWDNDRLSLEWVNQLVVVNDDG